MSSFRPPLRKRTVENSENSLTNELCCSEQHASAQNSQEVLSCGFLPPKQPKRTPFQPPLRDLVSPVTPGQNYIDRILHEGENRNRNSPTALSFELAPLCYNNSIEDNNDDSTAMKNTTVPKKHQYYFHIGNRKMEQPVKKPLAAVTNIPTTATVCTEGNESRFKIFEFQVSQATEKDEKPKQETTKPLIQVIEYLYNSV